MQDFLVLGIIPGTTIQLTFNFWLSVALIFCLCLFMSRLLQLAFALRNYYIALQIARAINKFELITI